MKMSVTWSLLLVVALALGLRIAYHLTRASVLDNEGTRYALMAEDLLNRRAFPHTPTDTRPELVLTWFSPLTIAGLTFFLHDSELAARIISMFAGTSLVVTIFFLAGRLFGRTAGWIAAVLTATFPVLVGFSTTGYCESLYMALLAPGIYFAIRCFEAAPGQNWLWAGLFLGFAYWTRTEALLIPFLAGLITMLAAIWLQRPLTQAALRVLGMASVMMLLIVPYGLLFRFYTGHFLLEGKNRYNYTIGQRILSGMPAGQAARGIGQDLLPEGPQLAHLQYIVASPYPMRIRDLANYFFRMAARNARWVFRELLPSPVFGSLLMPGLVLAGLVMGPWTMQVFWQRLFLILLLVYGLVILLAAHMPLFRYSLPLLPLEILFASNAVAGLIFAAESILKRVLKSRLAITRMSPFLLAAAVILVLVTAGWVGLSGVSELNEALPSNRLLRVAGSSVRPGGSVQPTLMSYECVIAYYAHANWLPLPYADATLALRYIASKHPDYVAVSYWASGGTPYGHEWLENGIPDLHAQLVFDKTDALGQRVRIYRWLDER